jgi:hypothetical protein
MERTTRSIRTNKTNQPKKLNVIPTQRNQKRTNKIKPTYIEFITEPWFSLIQLGLKTVEARKNKGKFKEMKVGDTIEWRNNNFKPRSFLTQVIGKAEYPNFTPLHI